MFWNESKRQYEPHPDCTCGCFEEWALRGINRPCHCRFLRPLDSFGQPIPYPVIDGLRDSLKSRVKEAV